MFRAIASLLFVGLLCAAAPAHAAPEGNAPDRPPGQAKKARAGHGGWLTGLDLTQEQEAAIRALREQIERETVGNNKVALWYLRQELKALVGEQGRGEAKGKRRQLDEATRAQAAALKARIRAMRQVIEDGHARFREGVLAILTDAQRAELERRKAEREARPKGPRADQPGKGKAKGRRQAPGQERNRYAGVSEEEAASHGIFWHPAQGKGEKRGQR